jgi:hypothetical protein
MNALNMPKFSPGMKENLKKSVSVFYILCSYTNRKQYSATSYKNAGILELFVIKTGEEPKKPPIYSI